MCKYPKNATTMKTKNALEGRKFPFVFGGDGAISKLFFRNRRKLPLDDLEDRMRRRRRPQQLAIIITRIVGAQQA